MAKVGLIFNGRDVRVAGLTIQLPRVPCVGEEVEFTEDYPDEQLAGCAFTVKQVGFQVASSGAQSIPLLVVGE